MKCRDELGPAVFEDTPPQARDRVERAQQRLGAELAERHDHLRFDDVDLLKQKRLARLDFVRLRVSVLRRTALDHVRDVDIVAREFDRFDDLRQQLTRAADEGNPLNVFVRAGASPTNIRSAFGLPTPKTI